jgi:peptidoglycan/LPS O-acetylase OafA/YrhL
VIRWRICASKVQGDVMGFLRLALALSVVAAHTGGKLWLDGRAAVILFYVISGYLITLVLDRSYANDWRSFYVNRALRIFVPAIVVFVLSVIAFAIAGLPSPAGAAPAWGAWLFSWLSNLLIVLQDFAWLLGVGADGEIVWQPYGTVGQASSLMLYQYNQPLFTVAIELYFYLLAPFVVRTPMRALAFAWIGLAYHVATQALGFYSLAANYHLFMSSWLYFGTGAVAYWTWRGAGEDTTRLCYLSLVAFGVLQVGFDKVGLPAAYLILLFALPSLLEMSRKVALDGYLASYSYLVYLVHWPIHILLQHGGGRWGEQGNLHALGVIVLSIAAAGALHHLVEKPLDAVRTRIRTSGLRAPDVIPAVAAPVAA